MTTRMNTNGLGRKSLSEQIDRLDAMLDGLAEGLNEAVATVVKDAVGLAVKEAVQAVLCEALANPELLARLLPVAPPAVPAPQPAPAAPQRPKVSWRQRFAALRKSASARLSAVGTACTKRFGQVRRWAGAVWLPARLLGVSGSPLLTALGVGLAAGAAAYFLGPWVAATSGAAGGFAATLAVRMLAALKRLLTRSAGSMA